MSSKDDESDNAFPPRPDIPPEPRLPYRLWFPALEHHATALGYVCINYAMLEDSINRLIEVIMPCSKEARRAIVDASGYSITTRCDLIIKLASIKAPNKHWLDSLEDNLAFVKNDITPIRNRFIHDAWVQGRNSKVLQWDQRSSYKKLQSRDVKKIQPAKILTRKLEDLWLLVNYIQTVSVNLSQLHMNFAIWLQEGRQLDTQGQYPPPDRAQPP